MSWNYRVVKQIHHHEHLPLEGETTYCIHEAYYEEGEHNSNPKWITEDPCYPQGETGEELSQDLHMMLRALGRPILNHEDF